MFLTCNEQGEGCRVGSHPLWCQEGEQQSWTRDTELPNVSWSKEKPVWSLWVKAGCVCVCATGARTYDHLKKSRDEERLKRTMLSEVLQYIQDSSACQQWLSRQADM